MARLKDIVEFCDKRTRRAEIIDFPGAHNGLQVENDGEVKKIGAAVDAGLRPFQMAAEAGVDFLITHHGMFWSPLQPIAGANRAKLRALFDADCALYSSHLPLDAHTEIGNNALIAKELGLEQDEWFLEHEGCQIGLIAKGCGGRAELADRLLRLFPETFSAIEKGGAEAERVAICSGSGASALFELEARGIDTLITGELKQSCFNIAEELQLNLYPCGHYATEVFGVRALAAEAAEAFGLDWTFLKTDCPL